MKVIHAELQSSVIFHTTEVLGAQTLDVQNGKNWGLEMEWKPDGLYLTTNKMRAQGLTGFIPAANVKCLRFQTEADVTPKDSANKKLKAL